MLPKICFRVKGEYSEMKTMSLPSAILKTRAQYGIVPMSPPSRHIYFCALDNKEFNLKLNSFFPITFCKSNEHILDFEYNHSPDTVMTVSIQILIVISREP